MNNVPEGFTLLIAVIVALIALGGVAFIRGPLRFVVLVAGILVEAYLLGFLPPISL